jgi:two-component system sensor histidine kinase/response regulator
VRSAILYASLITCGLIPFASLSTLPDVVAPPRARFNGYIASLLFVAATVIAAFALRDYLARSIFILFAVPVALTAWYAGRGPALAAAVVSLLSADILFIDRHYVVVPRDPKDLVAIAIFILVALVIVHVSGLLLTARDSADAYVLQLEQQSLAMQQQAAELEQQTEEAQALNEELEELNQTLEASAAAQLAEAQSLAKLGSWEWNIAGNSLKWSDEMYRLFGLDPEASPIDYETYQTLLHPDDRAHSRAAVDESLRTGEPFSFYHRVIRPDGTERIHHARGKVVEGPDGKPIRLIGTGQDVTDARRAETALRNAAEFAAKQKAAEAAARHLDRVLSQAPVVIAVLTGPDHVFELANAKAIETLGGRALVGQKLRDAVPAAAGGQYEALIDSVYSSGQPFVGREMYASIESDPQAPRTGYFNFVFQPLINETGVYAILIVANEVTDLVNARLAAEQSQREALAASRTKSDFLARMSHELRTPLAAIMGYGELLYDGITGPVNPEQKRQLDRIRASANHLLSIIDEILTLARMEAGKERAQIQEVGIHELLESVASMAEPLAAAKGLSFTLGNTQSNIRLKTDPMKLRQVLLNLISNAVKYTESGSVTLESEAADGNVHFFVKDTGVGVDGEHLEKIFEPFWQVEQTTTRRSGGTGLGLAVTRQFVDLLGGRISVASELGKGSAFQVTLPVQPREGFGVAETLDG